MSITDELRRVAAKTECANGRCERLYRGDLDHIADRIDAEYQKAIRELNNLADASVLLPRDADGECIHLGDVMEWVSDDECYSPVIRTVEAVGEGTFFAWDGINGRYAQYEAHAYRHHHAPTIEDVLREFGDWYAHVKGGCDEDGIIAEYAQRLQLREVDE